MFLVIFVSVFGNQLVGPEHIKASTYYVPGIAALAVLTASFSQLVIAITAQRESRGAKRRRATPAPASVIIAGRALTVVGVSVAVTAVVIAIGGLAYGVHLVAGGLGTLALSVAVGALVFACLGYAVSSAIGSADAAQPGVLALTLPLSFISGVYIPFPSASPPPSTTSRRRSRSSISSPHWAADSFPGTHGIAWGDLAILAAWAQPG